MKLKQVQEMNCGCSLTDGVITMCPMHEAGPKLWKAAEQLLQAHDDAHAVAAKDPDWEREHEEAMEGNEYTLTENMVRALFVIEEILGDGEGAYKLIEAVAAGVPGENQNHQPNPS